MKIVSTVAVLLTLFSSLHANDALPPPPNNLDTNPIEVTTPDWAVNPIGPFGPKKPPSSEMMRNKHIAAVVIGTSLAIVVGLIASGANTGKDAPPAKK